LPPLRAEALGVSAATVKRWAKSEEFQQVNILVQNGQLAPPEYIDKLQEVVDVEATDAQ
jgi:hypothetical protein